MPFMVNSLMARYIPKKFTSRAWALFFIFVSLSTIHFRVTDLKLTLFCHTWIHYLCLLGVWYL